MDVVDESPATALLTPEPTPPAPRLDAPDQRPGSEDAGTGQGPRFWTGWLSDTDWPPPAWAIAATLVLVAVGTVLRFWTHSDMWLDEALTVDISRLPLTQIHAALMRDGAPPLYYVLLHFWMKIFGSSNVAARALSGVISVATLPCVWLAGRRLGGRSVAAAAIVLIATSPFAIYYGTEARMYSLVAFLTTVGFLALDRALRKPTAWNLAATALVTALLLYTHYWALYLVAVTGAWLLFRAWRGKAAARGPARAALAAVVGGCVLFVPWVPTFLYQSAHTGTPWAIPANFAAMVNAVSSFAGGPTNEGRALALLYFALAGLGLFGIATDRFHISLDIRGTPLARGLGIIVVGTLVLAIAGGYLQRSAFSARYASVIFVPLLLLVAMGLGTFRDRRIATVILVAAAVFGLVTSLPNISTERSQAFQVASVLARAGKPGDIVAYCPDQLGPDSARLLPAGRYDEITFPRGTGPQFVNWINYAQVVGNASPTAFAHRLEQMSAPDHRIWYVWAPGYQTYGGDCEQIESTLLHDTKLGGDEIFGLGPYYEPSELVEFAYRTHG
jgi:mannosyltransferase